MSDDTSDQRRQAATALTRRQALALTLGAGISATAITLFVTDPADAARAGVFLHGVASGDPRTRRVVIWTRITKPRAADPIRVEWSISEDDSMLRVVNKGVAFAREDRDFTVKIDVTGLEPGRTYYYRFNAEGTASPIGRTRTLPEGHVDRLKLAVFSCSNFELGYFNPYHEASKRDDLDAVLHLGDYIYEYGPGMDGFTTPAAAAGLVPKPRDALLRPREEVILLEQYRARHALYRTDTWLQKVHRNNPAIIIWDDHEVANDAWTGGAGNHDPATEGPYQARRRAGLRAFYEWLPIREPADGARFDPNTGNPDDLYRAFDFGDLARLVMVDTRQAGRDKQLETGPLVAAYQGAPSQGPFPRDRNKDGTRRTLLGTEQETWFAKQMSSSTQTWQLIGNQVLMFYQGAPDLLGTALLTSGQKQQLTAVLDALFGPGSGQQVAELGAAGLPFPIAADAWTGYPTARVKMLAALAEASNPIVLTGDSHNAWTANLALPGPGRPTPVAAEFGGTSVSSPGFEQFLLGVPPDLVSALLVDTSLRQSPADKLIYSEASRRGFMLVDVTPLRVLVDHVFVSTVFEEAYRTETKRFRVLPGSHVAVPIATSTV